MKTTIIVLCVSILSHGMVMNAQGAIRDWTGAVSSDWNDSGNWNTGVPIAEADRGRFQENTANNYVVDIGSGNVQLGDFNTPGQWAMAIWGDASYTFNGSGTLGIITANTGSQGVISIGGLTAEMGNTQTFNTDVIFETGGGLGRISDPGGGTMRFNGLITLVGNSFEMNSGASTSRFYTADMVLTNGPVFYTRGEGEHYFSGTVSGYGNARFIPLSTGIHVFANTNGVVADSSLAFLRLGLDATIRLDAPNQIATHFESAITDDAVSTLNLNGFSNTNAGHLTVPADNGRLDILFSEGGNEEMWFADSSGQAWGNGAILNLINFSLGSHALRFGTDADGLTSSQLSQIQIDGEAAALSLDSAGYVIPEPGTFGLALFFGALLVSIFRRAKQ